MRVKGKVAIVTGAASGLGFAAVQKLLNEGSKVILTDINKDVLDTMDERLSAFSSSQFKTYHHDVSSEESWKEVIDRSELDFEGINIYESDAKALTQRLTSEMISLEVYQVLERSKMKQLLEEQKFQYSGCVVFVIYSYFAKVKQRRNMMNIIVNEDTPPPY